MNCLLAPFPPLRALASLLGLVLFAGCTRAAVSPGGRLAVVRPGREKAAMNPRWDTGPWNVYGDPRSRFFDECDPDKPPMPPDDPCSHVFMREIDGMKASKHWDDFGIARHAGQLEVAASRWSSTRSSIRTTKSFSDLDSSLQIALVNSSSYWTQLETIYLSALDVSTERFRFRSAVLRRQRHAVRPLGSAGRFQPAVEPRPQSGWMLGTRSTASSTICGTRRTPGSRKIRDGRRNRDRVRELGGLDVCRSRHARFRVAAEFRLVQPLLRGAGRIVALEQLTIVERNLLANLRAFQRYRQGFYTQVAVGDLGVPGPSRRGGFLGGTGLTGFTGQGSGGLGGVGSATGFGSSFRSPPGQWRRAGPAPVLPAVVQARWAASSDCLQQLQQLRNTEDSLALADQSARKAGVVSCGRPDHADSGRQPAAGGRDGKGQRCSSRRTRSKRHSTTSRSARWACRPICL